MSSNVTPVILSGGSGTRLWPLSRDQYPKQFLPLVTQQTLFQDTVSRLPSPINRNKTMVVCNQDHRFMVTEQLSELGIEAQHIFLEPVGRNTAPAITIAALSIHDTEEILLVLPSDHTIRDLSRFAAAIEQAIAEASEGALVTFGVLPTSAMTGYGYIQREKNGNRVKSFIEKPDKTAAQTYLKSGDYFWNSGIFAFRAKVFLQEMKKFCPDILEACKRASHKLEKDLGFIRIDAEAFKACPAMSVDHAVMEKTGKAVVIPLDAGWNDVGSWSSLWGVSGKDTQGNCIKGDILLENTQNSLLHSESRLVAAVGMSDVVVVETDDAVLVASKDQVQHVKCISTHLQEQHRPEFTTHRKVHRPWGWYKPIDTGPRHQVKRISVKPGAKLSLQMHFHRAEHWVVTRGMAKITLGDKEIVLTEDQSAYIPVGTKHRLENIGEIALEIIEVQTGSYLGEDDIVRFSDDYGRDEIDD